MNNKKRYILIGVFFIVLLVYIFIIDNHTSFASYNSKKHILILNSYHRGYEWSDNIEDGIMSVLSPDQNDIVIDFEYMDAKRSNDNLYFQKLYYVFKDKYKRANYDAIIACDNDSLNFLLKFKRNIFNKTPVVFCGINDFSNYEEIDRKKFCGIYEIVDIEETIDTALKLHPRTKNVLFIVDNTTTGKAFKNLVKKIIPRYNKRIDFNYIEDDRISSVKRKVEKLPKDSIIYCFPSGLKDKSGDRIPIAKSIEWISNNSDIPMYSSWEFFIGKGIVGGLITSGYSQGMEAAKLVQRILNGEEVYDIPIIKEKQNKYIFDYEQMKRFGILNSLLPSDSEIMNKDLSVYSIPKDIVYYASYIIIIVLICISLILFYSTIKRKKAESDAIENESKLRTLINAMPDFVVFKDNEGRWLIANNACLQIFNLRDKSYIGKRDTELVRENSLYREALQYCEKTDEIAWQKGDISRQKEIIPQPNGSYRSYDVYKVPVFKEDGTRKGMAVLGRDTTERDQMERELKESERFLKEITDNTIDMISLTDADGIFQYVTPSHKKILGYKAKDLLGKKVFDFVHKDDKKRVMKKFYKCIDKEKPVTVECKFKSKEGNYLYLEIVGKVLDLNNEAHTKAIFCSRDITQRKNTENKLRESEERYRRLIDFSPYGIYVHDEKKLYFSNKAGAKILGFDNNKDLIGKDIRKFIHKDNLDYILKKMDYSKTFKKPVWFEEQKLITKQGSIIHVEISISPFILEGEMKLLSSVKDISEQKKVELLQKRVEKEEKLRKEAEEYEKLRTEFFSNLSHELRTPLNVILGSIKLLEMRCENKSFNQKRKNRIKTLKQNCYRLLRLVNNLIDITKVDSGYLELTFGNHDIIRIVEDITLSVAEYIEQNEIKLLFDTNVEERIIACDPDSIERIILNLLSNAVKFTQEGGEILVTIYDTEKEILIKVKDNGVGIPKEKIKDVFGRFRQVDKSFRRSHEGSGIGLSLVKSLVEMHGGTISVNSTVGEGSEFIIRLPIKTIDKKEEIVNEMEIKKTCVERINIEFSDIYS